MHFDWEHTTSFEETNLVGNIYFSNYLKWQGVCRELFLQRYAPSVVGELASGELALVTVSCRCDYSDQLRALEDIVVRLRLGHCDSQRLGMRFGYYRGSVADAHQVATGEQIVQALRRTAHGYAPAPIPAELLAALELPLAA